MKNYNQIILLAISSFLKMPAHSATYVLDDFTARLANHFGVEAESITPRKTFINNSGVIAGDVFIKDLGGRAFMWKPGKGFYDVANQQSPPNGGGDLFVPAMNLVFGLSESGAIIGVNGHNPYIMYQSGLVLNLENGFGEPIFPISIDSKNNVLALSNGDDSYRYGIWSKQMPNLLIGHSVSNFNDSAFVPYALSGDAIELVEYGRGQEVGSRLVQHGFSNYQFPILPIAPSAQIRSKMSFDAQFYPVSANEDKTILANAYNISAGTIEYSYDGDYEYLSSISEHINYWHDFQYSRPVLIDPDGAMTWLAMPESSEFSLIVPKAMSSDAKYIIGQSYDGQLANTIPVVWEDQTILPNSGLQIGDRLQDVNKFGAIVFERPTLGQDGANSIGIYPKSGDDILIRYKVHPLYGNVEIPNNSDVLAVFDSSGHHTLNPQSEITGKNLYILTHGWARGIRDQIGNDPVPKIWNYTDTWYAEMAQAIASKDPLAVVVGYSWISGSATYTDIDAYNSRANAPLYGELLAEMLKEYDLANPASINLIGHSHGAIVSMKAGVLLESAGVDVKSIVLLDAPERALSLNGGLVAMVGGAAHLEASLNRFAYQYGIGEGVGETRIIAVSTMFGVEYKVDGVINLAVSIPPNTSVNDHSYAYVWYGEQVANAESVFDRWWLGDDAPRITPYQGQVEKVMAQYIDSDFLWAQTMVFEREQEVLFAPFDLSNDYAEFDRITLTLSYRPKADDGLIGIWIDENPFLFETVIGDDVGKLNHVDLDITGIEYGAHAISVLFGDKQGNTAYDDFDDVGMIISGVNDIPSQLPEIKTASMLIVGAVFFLSRRSR